jgi:hypothetical protein
MTTIAEPDLRQMRDSVFGRPSSDKNWGGCRENWMELDNVRWLQDAYQLEAAHWFCPCGAPCNPSSGHWRLKDGAWQHDHESHVGWVTAERKP